MGDSTCLMQPFCYASGLTNEANESNPIHALGQSVSFGRFVSESLAWEKWSSFSHNRYVEEAERYSRPGSVAQKKAFFEAHYKKLAAQKAAAAALLEQANSAAAQNNTTETTSPIVQNNATGQEDEGLVSVHDSETRSSEMVVKEEQGVKACHIISEPDGHDSGSNVEASIIVPQRNKVQGAKPEMVGNSMKIELQNQLEDVDSHKVQTEKISETPPIMTPTLKQGSNSDQEVMSSIGKKKPSVSSSFKLLKATGTSKVTSTPVKSTVPVSYKRDNIATPMSSNKHVGLSSADRKRYTPKSLQMSVNFTPIRELNRLTASVMRKFESARVGAGSSSKASKDTLTPLRTPTMASKKEMQKHSSLTPLTERRRNKTPLDLSSTGGPKWCLPPAENKMRSPIMISSPFSLRTEERAARRQKKLEEKFKANEAQKVQLHTKLKEKAETEIRKLRQSFCFKARPLPDFYKEMKASHNDTKKDPLTHSESTKEGRKATPSVVENKTFLPPHRPSLKNNGTKDFQGKSGRSLTHHLTSTSTIITTHENTSPNIQLGNRNDSHRYYKE